jgi:hypothetical protein
MHYYKQDEIKQHFQDYLDDTRPWQQWLDGERSDFEPTELHHEAFNSDHYIIGTWKATQWLGDRVFECIEIIKDYEQGNFGEVYTDLSSPEAVVNMYAYIAGEQVVHDWFESLGVAA